MRTSALWLIVLAMVVPLTARAGGVDWSEYIDKGGPTKSQPVVLVPEAAPAKAGKAKPTKATKREARSAKSKKAAKAKAKRAKTVKARK